MSSSVVSSKLKNEDETYIYTVGNEYAEEQLYDFIEPSVKVSRYI